MYKNTHDYKVKHINTCGIYDDLSVPYFIQHKTPILFLRYVPFIIIHDLTLYLLTASNSRVYTETFMYFHTA
jgi:hypothetical protein